VDHHVVVLVVLVDSSLRSQNNVNITVASRSIDCFYQPSSAVACITEPPPPGLMRPSTSSQTYVCLPCLLRTAPTACTSRSNVSTSYKQDLLTQSRRITTTAPVGISPVSQSIRKHGAEQPSATTIQSRTNTSSTAEPVKLNINQISKLGQLHGLRTRLKNGLSAVSEAESDPKDVPIEKILAALKTEADAPASPFLQIIGQVYNGRPYNEVSKELSMISKHRRPTHATVTDDATITVMNKLGILPVGKGSGAAKPSQVTDVAKEDAEKVSAESKLKRERRLRRVRKVEEKTKAPRVAKVASTLIRKELVKPGPVKDAPRTRKTSSDVAPARVRRASSDEAVPIPLRAPSDAKSIEPARIPQRAVETEDMPSVPKLSFDLSRVLFNPGVYHLQDPRSRVYNFDPYLEKIMPVTEFNFDALNPYITSSQDQILHDISQKHKKRYTGSTSSMSAAMSHFHFLLSAWRPIDPSILSQKISGLKSFTQITRTPSSIYLRWKNGTYAIDADKEYDTPNILMMQGKSMEKLLTLEKEDFEKYRKPKAGEQAPAIDAEPEAYHYSTVENFLLRSQLDAYDPRLPGTGMFDLKTRAVAGIRMIMKEHEVGMGYQIKDRFGMWESFDREYYDMIRSAFLKYSLQVRMGRMDGIFVAYHNIARIFGFQYVSLEELDMALHGQPDRVLGDREFRATLKLMNEIFDEATKEYPEQSLRIMFETRESSKTEPNGYMRVFAEPMTDEEIDKVQKSGKDKVEEYEKKMSAGIDPKASEPAGKTIKEKMSSSTLESNAADIAFLDDVLSETTVEDDLKTPADTQERPVISWLLHIYNEVNGASVARPNGISTEDRWVIRYKLDRVADSKSRPLYNASRNRRAADLQFNLEAKARNYFTDKLRIMSESGRVWREEQDALDSQREKVMLYNLEQ